MSPSAEDHRRQRVVLLKVVIATAYADGEFASVERQRIEQLMDFLRIDEASRAELRDMLDNEIVPPMPHPTDLPAYEMRLYAFQQALILAFEDGVIHRGEEDYLDKLAAALELKPADVEKGWQRAREMRVR